MHETSHVAEFRFYEELNDAEQRILLTRDRGLLKQRKVTHGYLVRSPHLLEQVLEVLRRFDLASRLDPFSRCGLCNGPIVPADKASVESALSPKVRESFQQFFQCATCGQVYWQGTHFARLQASAQALMRIDTVGEMQNCQEPTALFGS